MLKLAVWFAGDLADQLITKVLKKDEKRKEDKKETKEKEKKRKPAFRGGFRPQPMFNPYGWQNPQAMGYPQMPQAPQAQGAGYPMGYNSRPDFRSCLNCKQVGHIARACLFLGNICSYVNFKYFKAQRKFLSTFDDKIWSQ